jgi:glucose-1-phosphatase
VIKNIIFDLGNVLVRVNFARSKKLLLSAGVKKEDLKRFFNKKIRNDFELGRISTSEFMDRAYLELGRNVTKTKLKKLFVDMFEEIPEMKRFLKQLAKEKKYRLYILSNTNPLHFNYCRKRFKYINLIDKFILSYKIKMVKPNRGVFKMVIKKFNLVTSETLFVDDLVENCKAAEDTGIKTICYRNYSSFIKRFEKLC